MLTETTNPRLAAMAEDWRGEECRVPVLLDELGVGDGGQVL